MRCRSIRTWKAQDIQAQRPLSWCRQCGREIYEKVGRRGLCPLCRRESRRPGP